LHNTVVKSINFIILTLVMPSMYSPVRQQWKLSVTLTDGCTAIEN